MSIKVRSFALMASPHTPVRLWVVWFVLCAGMHVLGVFAPELAWSTHFVGLLTGAGWAWIMVACLAGVVLLMPRVQQLETWNSGLSILFPAVGYALWSWMMPIVFDVYGEAPKLMEFFDKVPPQIPEGTNAWIWNFGIEPWDGQYFTFSVATYIAYWFQESYSWAFRFLDSWSALGFAAVWGFLLREQIAHLGTRKVLWVAGLLAPFCLNFFGHIEVNAPVLFTQLLCLRYLALAFQRPRKLRFLGVVVLWLLAMKFHATTLLIAPALILLAVHCLKPGKLEKFTWKRASWMVLAPVLAAFLILYFGVYGDDQDDRSLASVAMAYDHLFLPLESPAPPLDSYNLHSAAHLWDYFAEIMLWPSAFLGIVLAALAKRKHSGWNRPEVLGVGCTFIFFFGLFAVTNPLLSMQLDWDLFAFPSTALLVFGVLLLREVNPIPSKFLLPGMVMLSAFNLTWFVGHAERESLADHYAVCAFRIYPTYYEWSYDALKWSVACREANPKEAYQVYAEYIQRFEPKAVPGVDREVTKALTQQARYWLRDGRNLDSTFHYLDRALRFETHTTQVYTLLMEASFVNGNMDEAYTHSLNRIRNEEVDGHAGLRATVHCALMADRREDAVQWTKKYLKSAPGDAVMQDVLHALDAGVPTSEIAKRFSGGS